MGREREMDKDREMNGLIDEMDEGRRKRLMAEKMKTD